jgi:superfamily II DNA or RNA helicase
MPPIDFLAVDEAHHAAADTYRKIIDAAYAGNPNIKLLGVTATPNRGDKKALRGVFSNVADQITLKELIAAGHLVRPRTFVIDLGVRDELAAVKRTVSDFDMGAVEKIMDKQVLNDKIVEEWKHLAGDRQTIIFCSTVEHAQHVAHAFAEAGVRAACVHGEMSEIDRRGTLDRYDRNDLQVVTNVAVLTEGWDHQPTSCVILLRPSSYKSTMIQMIGRGLRKVDPERYPGRRKDECIVIDFGTSILMHGDIEQSVDLDGKGVKDCPECHATIPAQSYECPICGFEFPKPEAETKQCPECGTENAISASNCIECDYAFTEREEREAIGDFILTEVDLLKDSPFKWEPLFEGLVMVATAFDDWAMLVAYGSRWMALGGGRGRPVELLADNEDRFLSLASADDYLREHGDTDEGSKMRRWLNLPATEKQMQYLGLPPMAAMQMSRYQAASHLTWKFNERAVRHKLEMAQQGRIAA